MTILAIIFGAIVVFGLVYLGIKDIVWMRRERRSRE